MDDRPEAKAVSICDTRLSWKLVRLPMAFVYAFVCRPSFSRGDKRGEQGK